jgi:hypothetical protein
MEGYLDPHREAIGGSMRVGIMAVISVFKIVQNRDSDHLDV